VSAVCPSCRSAVPLLRVHRAGFDCPGCGVTLRVQNFYSAMSQALCLGSIPMLFAVTPVEWLIVLPISAMASISLYGAMMTLVVKRRARSSR
jgi:ABC-type Na+ efflux pump permease subunit